jgi:glutamate synthase (NADPH/NADH) small chain
VEFDRDKETGRPQLREIRGTDFEIDADLVILAIGFLHPEHGLPRQLGIGLDNRGNLRTDTNYMTSRKGFFSAGDMRRGQSLIVRAISEGRRAAYCMDKYLMGSSNLPVL